MSPLMLSRPVELIVHAHILQCSHRSKQFQTRSWRNVFLLSEGIEGFAEGQVKYADAQLFISHSLFVMNGMVQSFCLVGCPVRNW